MLEDDLDHLREVLGQDMGDLVGRHPLGHRREAPDVAEEDDDGALGAAELDLAFLTRDLLGQVGGEVALEVG